MAWYDYTKYLGPIGYGIDKVSGHDDKLLTSYFDPGDILNKESAKDVGEAGKEAQKYLQQLSDTAWQRQMSGLQQALGSMNSYNGILSQIYGVPTNYYDPAQSGGVLGVRPGSQPPPYQPVPGPVPTVAPSMGAPTQTARGRGAF